MPVILSHVLWQDDYIYVDDAMRLIAPRLLHICSRDGAFSHLAPVPENSELYMELVPLVAAKNKPGDGEGFPDQLQPDQDSPFDERLEAVSDTILAWREPNLSYFG